MKTAALIVLGMLSGCATPARVEPLVLLEGQTEVIAFRSDDRERKVGRKISVEGLPEILSRATWVEDQVYHKGGNWVRFSDGREVFLPVSFEFVLVRGAPGYFEIRPEDRERYRTIVQRIQKEVNQSPQPTSRLRPAAAYLMLGKTR